MSPHRRDRRSRHGSPPSPHRARKRGKPNAALRLFLAIYPPLEVAQGFLDQLRSLESLPPHREVIPEQVHLTLHFIGDTEPRHLDDTIESIDSAKKGIHAFELKPTVLVAYPKRGGSSSESNRRLQMPRLVAAETDAPSDLLELRRRVVRRLTRRPMRRDVNDRFTPHFTLCRFRSFRPADYPLDELDWTTSGASVAKRLNAAIPVHSFMLMKSTLRREGAVHEPIATWPLTSPR